MPGPAAARLPAFQTAHPGAHTLPASSPSPPATTPKMSSLSRSAPAIPTCSRKPRSGSPSPAVSVLRSANQLLYRSARCSDAVAPDMPPAASCTASPLPVSSAPSPSGSTPQAIPPASSSHFESVSEDASGPSANPARLPRPTASSSNSSALPTLLLPASFSARRCSPHTESAIPAAATPSLLHRPGTLPILPAPALPPTIRQKSHGACSPPAHAPVPTTATAWPATAARFSDQIPSLLPFAPAAPPLLPAPYPPMYSDHTAATPAPVPSRSPATAAPALLPGACE